MIERHIACRSLRVVVFVIAACAACIESIAAQNPALYDASTLDELWPEQIQYAPVPWKTAAELGPRSRPLEYWDHRPD